MKLLSDVLGLLETVKLDVFGMLDVFATVVARLAVPMIVAVVVVVVIAVMTVAAPGGISVIAKAVMDAVVLPIVVAVEDGAPVEVNHVLALLALDIDVLVVVRLMMVVVGARVVLLCDVVTACHVENSGVDARVVRGAELTVGGAIVVVVVGPS